MNTKQIDFCIELAHTLNFSKAAENLFVSQPSFSYQIKELENEIGFDLFERSGKGATLTPAGEQFCFFLENMREELRQAIEQGQNFSVRYKEDVSIGLPVRSAIYFLPRIIQAMGRTHPDVSITPRFMYNGGLEAFQKNEIDIMFALDYYVKKIPDIQIYPLFESRLYVLTRKDDVLADKKLVTADDLKGRTLMIGGGSPPVLRNLQQRLIHSGEIDYFNSHDHDTTLTNIAAGKGICISPGFLNSHDNEFAWIPFDCSETIPCVLCTHKNDHRDSTKWFINIIQEQYKKLSDFPL